MRALQFTATGRIGAGELTGTQRNSRALVSVTLIPASARYVLVTCDFWN